MPRSLQESKLANLDLNLLLSLDALLQERSVSRAAERLGLSQPSLSASLARLRRHFRDDLLARTGNRYELTPMAAQLAEQTTGALAAVARVFASEPDFDPATSEREFTVMISDYAITVLGPSLAALLRQAPHVRLRLHQIAVPAVDDAASALRDVDAIVLPHGFLSDLPSQELFTDKWVCIVAADHPGIGEKLTMADLERLPMVVTYKTPTAYTPAAKQLSMLGVQPRVQLVAESFLALPFLVAAGNGLALIQERLARQLAPTVPIRILPCPFDVASVTDVLWWHPMYDRDPGHRWLRQLFTEAARSTRVSSDGKSGQSSTWPIPPIGDVVFPGTAKDADAVGEPTNTAERGARDGADRS